MDTDTIIATEELNGYIIAVHADNDAPNPVDEFDFPGDGAYEAWLNGDVYGYTVTYQGNTIDSCWGYYGEFDYCLSQAREFVAYDLEERKQQFERTWHSFDVLMDYAA